VSTNRFLGISAPGVAELKPYIPGKPLSELERELGIRDSIKLASNENPLGCSDRALAVMHAALKETSRYPDGGGFALRNALSEWHGVDRACITLGNGSNDVLDMIARAFLWQGRESLFSQHAFAVYPISSQACGATLKVAPAKAYGHDLEAMAGLISENTGVIWIANPNNPTGTWIEPAQIRAFLGKVPERVIVVLDEAYVEYVDRPANEDCIRWLADFPNLIITRTFSKAYGLAGLRVGYGASHPDVADLLNRVRQPFNVNSFALAAAEAALADQAFIERAVAINKAGMGQLTAGFDEMGLEYIPSAGNFVSVDVGRPVGEVDQLLLREGCIGRPIANYGLPRHLRVSVGLEAENARFLASMKKVLGK